MKYLLAIALGLLALAVPAQTFGGNNTFQNGLSLFTGPSVQQTPNFSDPTTLSSYAISVSGQFGGIAVASFNGYEGITASAQSAAPAIHATGLPGASGPVVQIDAGPTATTALKVIGNVDAGTGTITAAHFNGDAATVHGHGDDIVIAVSNSSPGQTCTVTGYLVLSTTSGGTAKVPYCQ